MQILSRILAPTALAGLLAAGVVTALAERAPSSAIPSQPDTQTIVHVLGRLGYGPRPGDLERVRAKGLAAYIDGQLHPERLADDEIDRRLEAFRTLTLSTEELADRYFLPALMERRERQRQAAGSGDQAAPPEQPRMSDTMREQQVVLAELNQQKLLRAISSERQLQEVLVDFWFNHFNVFAGKGPTRIYLASYERDVIRPHALGKFRDLLGAVAESPAMLFYLDNWMSSRGIGAPGPSDAPGIGGPERLGIGGPQRPALPRRPTGLNENYARELLELHTLGVDGGYTQKDVVEVARAFTGWTIARPRRGGGFRFEPRFHDDGEKIVLGQRIGGGGKKDGDRVLDIVARHPSTARFIATKLARRFVSDEPPGSLVDRAAAKFRNTDGDIREVVRTIVTSPEFFSPAARRAKVKTPLEFVASAVRATGAGVANPLPLARALRDLGMPPYFCQPPTGYDDTAEAWVNTGALLNRMNFAVALADGTLRGVRVDAGRLAAGADGDSRRAAAARTLLAGQISAATAATLAKTDEPVKIVALVLGSPEFQRR
jgi:uncharacterized protein (DUF1800 family)